MQSINFRQLASNFIFLSGGEVISKIFTFAAFVFLARILGPTNFGYLEFTLAVMVFFTLLVDFGSSPYGAREIAKDRSRVGELTANIVALRILFAIAGYLLLIAFVFLLPDKEAPVRRLILIYGLTLFGIPGFLQWIYQGFDQMKWVALGSIIRQMIFAIGVFLLIRHADQLWMVALIECTAVSAFVLYHLYIFKSRIGRFRPPLSLRSLRSSFVGALPIGLSELTWASTWYFATILLGLMVEGKVVGWFSAAHRPVMTLHTFVWLYFYNLLPSLSRCTGQPQEILQNLMSRSIRITAWSAVFLGTVCMVLAEPMMTLIFGAEYFESVSIFKVLIWMVPITLLSGHYRYALIAFNHQTYEFISSACAAAVSVVLGLVLIPRFAAHGAAVALLLAAAVNWIMAYIFVQQKIGRIPFAIHIMRPLIGGGTMVVGFLLLLPLNTWLAGTAGFILFGLTLIILQPEIKRILV